MAIQWEAQQFLDTYATKDGDPDSLTFGQVFTYGKRFMELFQDPYTAHRTFGIRRARRIIQILDDLTIGANARILVVGAGFGDLIRAIRNPNSIPGDTELTGRSNTWGMDNSAWLESQIATEQAGASGNRILWENFGEYATQPVQDALNALTGGVTFRVVITDDVVSSLTPLELPDFLDTCESAITGINFAHCIHYTTTIQAGQTPPTGNDTTDALRWLRLQQWANQRDSHTWLGPRGQTIMGV